MAIGRISAMTKGQIIINLAKLNETPMPERLAAKTATAAHVDRITVSRSSAAPGRRTVREYTIKNVRKRRLLSDKESTTHISVHVSENAEGCIDTRWECRSICYRGPHRDICTGI
jgi:hypothetical protein